MRITTALALGLLVTSPLHAACGGHNLIAALPAPARAALQAAADAAPYASGNLWQATKGDQTITLIGTFHLDDPRHAATMAEVLPALTEAKTLLVEAGPDEEAALKSLLAAHPERLIHNGPTLPEALPPADWTRLSDALKARGIPPFFAAKLQPWYVATLLAVPACQFAEVAAAQGLDRRLMQVAVEKGIPIKALEPFDALFAIFARFTEADQIDMLQETLATVGPIEEDMAVTLSDSYFTGNSRLFWEYSRQQMLDQPGADPAEVARQFDLVETAMMTDRNRKWIPVIEAQAAQGPLVVAFGALHLAGDAGVLNLLAQDGWAVTRVTQ